MSCHGFCHARARRNATPAACDVMTAGDGLKRVSVTGESTKPGGCADTDALRTVRRLVSELRCFGPEQSGSVREKPGRIESWADLLFGARKHEQWGGGCQQVRHVVLCDCARLRMNYGA
jgi:hypothetical protein